MSLVTSIKKLHDAVFGIIEKLANGWLISTLARLTFLAVLFGYFWNSGKTKIGEGLFGIFNIQDGAYFQILGEAGMLAYEFDTANIPWHLDAVVFVGTISEFLLPLLIVIGLFTRIAAAGMAIFVIVQSYVDIYVHQVDAGTIGQLFDREATSLVMDQRALWMFLFIVLIVKGAGYLSVDRLLANWWRAR
ncbi:MAG: DoxX family protein [Salaquimonas sp.]